MLYDGPASRVEKILALKPFIWKPQKVYNYGIYQLSYICHIPGIYLSYETPFYTGYIYLVYTFPMKLYAPPGCRISIAMQQHTGFKFGLQGCLMFCRMWRRCHWASVSQPEGRAVARLGTRRQSRAVEPPTPTPTAA